MSESDLISLQYELYSCCIDSLTFYLLIQMDISDVCLSRLDKITEGCLERLL